MGEEALHVGATILLPGTHQNPENHHICIVLSDPEDTDGRQVLYVPITTARKKCDETCILEVGDHPFIKHTSCVHYAMMNQRSEAHLLKVGKLREPLQPDVLGRVLDGVMRSPRSAPWAKKFLSGE